MILQIMDLAVQLEFVVIYQQISQVELMLPGMDNLYGLYNVKQLTLIKF